MSSQKNIPEKIQRILEQYEDINEAPLYSSSGLNVYLDLIKVKYDFIDIHALLAHANMKMEEIKDPGHWFNQYQINSFMDYLIRRTGNAEIGREAGRFTCAPEALGMLRPYYLAFATPLFAFKKLNKLAADVSLSSEYQSNILSSNKIEIIVTPYDDRIKEEQFQCDNRKGYFEGIFQLFDLPLPKIDHDECMFDKKNKAKRCRYILSWETVNSERYKRNQNIALLISFIIIGASLFVLSFSKIIKLFILMSFIHIVIKLFIDYTENKELRQILSRQSLDETNPYSELFEQIQKNYQAIEMFRQLSMGLSKSHLLKESLQVVINVLRDKYDRCAILLANADKSKLIYECGFGYTDEHLKLWESTGWFHILKESTGTFIRSFRENRSFLINNIDEVINDFSLRSAEFAKKMHVKSLVCCPIYYNEQPLGVLAVDNHENKRELIQSDTNLLMGIANQIAIRIQYHKMAVKEKSAAMVDMALQAVHNIRNPSNAIDTNLNFINKFCEVSEKVNNKLIDIKYQNSRILELAKNFLSYTKPLELRKEKFLINQFIQKITGYLDKDQLIIKIEPSNPSIEADTSQLKWVFEELIENTKKYGDFPIEITIKIPKSIEAQKSILQINYKDNGKGIPDDYRDSIFEVFFSGNKQGSGLGLSNIQKIIEEHGGTISLSSKKISGTCFIIQLPIVQE